MQQNARYIHFVLRIAVAMCFIGHGSFGIITKPVWCNYFAVMGLGEEAAYFMMPVVGVIDIFLGLSLLLYPLRIVPAWLVVWGLFTALLRPLSGEPFAEFIERAGNYGAPLAMLILAGIDWPKMHLLDKIDARTGITDNHNRFLEQCLKVSGFLLLTGHAWLNLSGKPALLQQYGRLGFSAPAHIAQAAGVVELIFAGMVLLKPNKYILPVIILWKMGSELFYPHWALFEWVERAGSYGVLIALWLMQPGVWRTGKQDARRSTSLVMQ